LTRYYGVAGDKAQDVSGPTERASLSEIQLSEYWSNQPWNCCCRGTDDERTALLIALRLSEQWAD
jgi:hypothetical protein